jgi:hypothetical protein
MPIEPFCDLTVNPKDRLERNPWRLIYHRKLISPEHLESIIAVREMIWLRQMAKLFGWRK